MSDLNQKGKSINNSLKYLRKIWNQKPISCLTHIHRSTYTYTDTIPEVLNVMNEVIKTVEENLLEYLYNFWYRGDLSKHDPKSRH